MQESLQELVEFRDSDLLSEDAKADVAAMVHLYESVAFSVNSTLGAVYPFLIGPNSPGGLKLRENLAGFSGDMLTELWGEIEKQSANFAWLNVVPATVRTLHQHFGKPVTSEALLGAIIGYDNFDVSRLLRGGKFNGTTFFRSFLAARGISPETVCRRLLGLERGPEESAIPQRFSVAIRVLESGFLQAEVHDRWGQHAFAEEEHGVASTHGLLIPERAVFLPGELEDFERLLNAKPPAHERAFQEFFEAHPKWMYLLGEQYEKIAPQIQLPPVEIRQSLGFVDGRIDEGDFFPDFMLKRIGLELWDVLDIKRASPRVVVGAKSRRKFSAAVYEAVAQLREYTDRLRQNEVREFLRSEHGITIARPIAMVVIGRDFEFRTMREKDILKSSDGVRIYTYDDLQRLARHRALVSQ